tara:strand:- start:3233 stop:3490 length:258 start_codon:yes stop_codon:yes gene_type:complete
MKEVKSDVEFISAVRRLNFIENLFIDNRIRLTKQVDKLHESNSSNYNSIVINDIKNTIKRIEKYNKDLYLANLKKNYQINKDNIL